jgi:excisionase family DNA binding protein
LERLFTAKEVAGLVGLKPTTIVRKARKGEIPALKLGRQFRFDKNQIEEWLQSNRITGQPHILIIDDEVDICELAKIVLEKAGYLVSAVSNGKEAIRLLGENQFTLVFLDLGMPEVSGLEILKYIKNSKINTEVIIMTGYQEGAHIMSAAMDYGSFFVMKKPFTNDELLEVTARFISTSG